ncbi:MAG: uracil-DNA glycosylase [Saprospiraceae bacterium]|nr:uracil-DNA glycosylase [Saprospiraceae bacterium]
MEVKIENGWKMQLQSEFEKDYFKQIKAGLIDFKKNGKAIYPPGPLIFNAFNLTPWDQVKVIILGQDPYHGSGEAMGLCFSVPNGIPRPPSLKNIFKELHQDLGCKIPKHGDLSHWANQGVLLLNASLTVEKDKPNSHKTIGWHIFTDRVISLLSEQKQGLVFLLWGNFAKSKKILIDPSKHLILESPHPSPLAGTGFFNNHHFSKTNQFLTEQQKTPIDWEIKKRINAHK